MSNKQSLLLDPDTWDLSLDNHGNLALASEPYSLAQDAACAVRLFVGELYYDITQGVPYWQSVLGRWPPLSLIKAQYIEAAMTVPGVNAAKVFLANTAERRLSGQVQITDRSGVNMWAYF